LAVVFEVDAFFGRVRREPRAVQDHELDVRNKFTLTSPREVTVADTSVHENETLHGVTKVTRNDGSRPFRSGHHS
jgi:hypothetical protein